MKPALAPAAIPLFVALAAACAPAAAQIDIATGAVAVEASSTAQTFGPPVTQAWGWSMASAQGANTVFGTGAGPCSAIVCPPGPSVGGSNAASIGRADASRMNVGVRAFGGSSGPLSQGAVDVEVKDSLTTSSFTTLSFAIHLDLDVIASAVSGTEARYTFGITVGDGDFVTGVFGLRAERLFNSQGQYVTTAEVYLNNATTVIDLGTIPSSYDVTVPVAFTPGSTTLRVFAAAQSEASQPNGFADADAYNSAWLGIAGSFTSANGYAYPGFAPVPEPPVALLLALGLGVGAWARRLRRTP